MAIPLVMAAVEIGAGAAAIGAAAGATIATVGGLAITTGMIAGGLMVAGGALAMVGTVTGNSKLTMIGSVMGLAGGVGTAAIGAFGGGASATAGLDSAASSASNAEGAVDAATGLPSSGVDAAGTASNTVDGAAGSTSFGSDAGPGEGGPSSSAPSATVDAPTTAPDGIVDGNVATPAEAAKGPINPLLTQEGALNDVSGVTSSGVTDQSGAGAVSDQSSGVKSFGGDTGGPGDATDLHPNGPDAPAPKSFVDKIGDAAKGAGGFIKDNKELVNLGGGIIGGAMKSASEQAQLKQQWAARTKYEQANRDRLNASVRGLAMPTYQAPRKV